MEGLDNTILVDGQKVLKKNQDLSKFGANSQMLKFACKCIFEAYNKFLGGDYTSKAKKLSKPLLKLIRRAIRDTHLKTYNDWVDYFLDIKNNRHFLWTKSKFSYGDVCKYPTTISKLCSVDIIKKMKKNPKLYYNREANINKLTDDDLAKLDYFERLL